MTRTHPATTRFILTVLLAACCLAAPGCNIVGPLFYLIHGPEKVKKVHTLDKKKTTVIFVDDRANNVPRRSLRVIMGEEAEKTLLKRRAVEDVVTTQSAMAAAGNDRLGKPLSNTEIGEAVKAQVLIYATVDAFILSTDGTTLAPMVEMRVRVIDVAADKRLFPEDPAGHRIVSRLPATAKDMPASTSARYQIEEDMARFAGLELAQLFYDHERNRGARVPE